MSVKENIPASTESSSLCDATGGSRSSFLWSELPGFVRERRSYPQKQLLCKLQLQNRAEGWTHVLPPRSGRTTFLFVSRLLLEQGFIRSVFLSVQEGVCQVFLYDGHVVVRAGNSEIKTQKTYNDDNSHYISIYNNMNGYAWKL